MDWHIEVDEAMFLGGLAKGPFLREFEPDFFFDDQTAPRRVGVGARAGRARAARRGERVVGAQSVWRAKRTAPAGTA